MDLIGAMHDGMDGWIIINLVKLVKLQSTALDIYKTLEKQQKSSYIV